MKPPQPPLERVRQQTDKSLTDERDKTDESFEKFRETTELETDRVVSSNRHEADRERFRLRSEADVERDRETDVSEVRVRAERKQQDTEIDKERKKYDIALGLERDGKERELKKIVSLERETTDKKLSGERAKSDQDAETAGRLLNVEQEAHSDTKDALTTREEFVAIVSHDLRNPIGAILSSAEVLLEESSLAINEDARRWLEIIKRNAEVSLRLIGDILDMERIVDGKLKLQVGTCRIAELLREAVESQGYMASAKKITLTNRAENFDVLVNCDSDRITQVLSNLLGNAIKFTPVGGAITVDAEGDGHEIKVSVVDNGYGIPESQKNRIFERFAQIGNKDRNGLGLGLYISKTLVELHRGKLWVESLDGGGSRFCFTLPHSCDTF